MKVTAIPIMTGAFGKVTKGLLKGTVGLGSWWLSGDHPNDNIIEKIPEDLRRLAVTQTPVKDHQLKLKE